MEELQPETVDVCIIGAGLSGAYAAKELFQKHNKTVTILDARHRTGGRLLTNSNKSGDLGGAWIWPSSEKRIQQSLELETVPMLYQGQVCARSRNGQRHVLSHPQEYAACGSGAVRIRGGAFTLVKNLLQEIPSIQLNMKVTRIEYDDATGARVYCTNNNNESSKTPKIIHCRTVLLAAPPKILVNNIEFIPPLPKQKAESMYATPTWMQDYGKVAVSFHVNWWRAFQMSGVSIDQMGPVATWWEACSGQDGDGARPTLAGFVTSKEATHLQNVIQQQSSTEFHNQIMDSLCQVYGVNASTMGFDTTTTTETTGSIDKDGLVVSAGGITVTYKSWKEDPYTNLPTTKSANYECAYGDQELQKPIGPLFFAGTETAKGHGHMEGAIIAAQRAVNQVLEFLK